MAGIQAQKGDYREAAAALERAIALAPDEAKYHIQLGRVRLVMKELEESEKCFRRALDLLPRDRFSGPHAALGLVLSMQKQHEAALKEFQKCREIEPENSVFHYALGAQYDILGRKDEAIDSFKEYLRLGGTTYRKNAAFILQRLGVDVASLPPPSRPSREESWGLDLGAATATFSRAPKEKDPGARDAGPAIPPVGGAEPSVTPAPASDRSGK
jgi:tetratricopeptide (TPR) repeat protein